MQLTYGRLPFAVSLCLCLLAATSLSQPAENTPTTCSFRFVVLGDRTGPMEPGVFEKILDETGLLAPDFVINVGDLIWEGNETETRARWDEILGSIRSHTYPFYYVPGDNDVWDEASAAIYTEKTGASLQYSFDFKNAHFIVLDGSRVPEWGGVGSDVLVWLREELAAHAGGQPIFVLIHKPVWLAYVTAKTTSPLHELLKEFGVDYVISGHWHLYAYQKLDGISYVLLGPSGAGHREGTVEGPVQFHQYLLFTVVGETISPALIKAGNVLPLDFVDDASGD